jgi:hypothetical protein
MSQAKCALQRLGKHSQTDKTERLRAWWKTTKPVGLHRLDQRLVQEVLPRRLAGPSTRQSEAWHPTCCLARASLGNFSVFVFSLFLLMLVESPTNSLGYGTSTP